MSVAGDYNLAKAPNVHSLLENGSSLSRFALGSWFSHRTTHGSRRPMQALLGSIVSIRIAAMRHLRRSCVAL